MKLESSGPGGRDQLTSVVREAVGVPSKRIALPNRPSFGEAAVPKLMVPGGGWPSSSTQLLICSTAFSVPASAVGGNIWVKTLIM